METRPLLLVMSLVACSLSDAAPLAPQVRLPCSCLFLFSFPVTSPSQSSFDVCQPSTHTHTHTHPLQCGNWFPIHCRRHHQKRGGCCPPRTVMGGHAERKTRSRTSPLFIINLLTHDEPKKSISILPVLSSLSVFQLIISKKVFVCNAKKGR